LRSGKLLVVKKNIIVLHSHPIQYFVPLYQRMAKEPDLEVTVLFCTDDGAARYFDKGFGTEVKWDLPLLDDYRYLTLKSSLAKPSLEAGFWGLLNWSVVTYLWNAPRSLVVVHGWSRATDLLAIVSARLFGHRVGMRCDTPVSREALYAPAKKRLRRLVFRWLLFPWVSCFLYVGKQNRDFYTMYGAREKQLFFLPFSVDNERFRGDFFKKTDKARQRELLGLPRNRRIFVAVGKYIPVKQLMQLLRAFKAAGLTDALLVLVGDGEIRSEMEAFIQKNGMEKNVVLTGFVNQRGISAYYAAADVFVMCSRLDAWGLAVNEAMCFNLPLLLSDKTCCADDLVQEGENGFTYPHHDESALSEQLRYFAHCPGEDLDRMGQRSWEIVQWYSYEQVIEGFRKA